MRAILVCVMVTLLGSPAIARAQEQSDSHKLVKVLVGAGALAVGTAVAATSSQTTTVNSVVGTSQTSTFSKSQLITGLAIAGAGGIVLWDALRSHEPRTQIGVSVGPRTGLFIRRHW
jgi:hypothetical protein